MATDQNKQGPEGQERSVNIGNASNPAPHTDKLERMSDNQFLSAGAEKYLREVSSPEDYPDAQDEQEMNETIRKEQGAD